MTSSDQAAQLAASVDNWLGQGEVFARLITSPPSNAASAELLSQLLRVDYVPGTFILAERKHTPAFLRGEDNPGYEPWIESIVRSDIVAINHANTSLETLHEQEADILVAGVLAALNLPLEGGLLCERITNQETDYSVWRILMAFLFSDCSITLPTHGQFNNLGKNVILPLLADFQQLSVGEQWCLIMDSGLIGLDIKDLFPGTRTSKGWSQHVIQLGGYEAPSSSESVKQQLWSRLDSRMAIDYREMFASEFLQPGEQKNLLWFTDDYIETIFDLSFISALLNVNQYLRITVVPRNGYFGNDASYQDISTLLADPRFFSSASFISAGRLIVHPEGPAMNGFDARKISTSLAQSLLDCDAVVMKGARMFEMAQGLGRPIYFANTVTNSFSEALSGLDSSMAERMLLRQDPGVPSFADFRAKAYRYTRLRSGRIVGVARMTSIEYTEARTSEAYKGLLEKFGNDVDHCNNSIMDVATRTNRTFYEVVYNAPPPSEEAPILVT